MPDATCAADDYSVLPMQRQLRICTRRGCQSSHAGLREESPVHKEKRDGSDGDGDGEARRDYKSLFGLGLYFVPPHTHFNLCIPAVYSKKWSISRFH